METGRADEAEPLLDAARRSAERMGATKLIAEIAEIEGAGTEGELRA
jgi:hypothetical protein